MHISCIAEHNMELSEKVYVYETYVSARYLCSTVSNAEDEGQADISERSILPNSF